MPKNKNRSPFTETAQYEKVYVQAYGSEVYISTNNGRTTTEVVINRKQVKALRKALKDALSQLKDNERRQGVCF